MIYEDMKKDIEEIKMTDDMKKRIIRKCYSQIYDKEEHIMKNNTYCLKKLLPLIAAIILCVFSVSAVVANHFRGFRDVMKGTAVVDTVYEEIPEMIKIDTKFEDNHNLLVSVKVEDFINMPYKYLEMMKLENYEIIDASGNIVIKGSAEPISEFKHGEVAFEILLGEIPDGEYELVIHGFQGIKKADSPLRITGTWKSSFVKNHD